MSNLWRAVLFLHLLAMAFFVGGQLVLAAAVMPVVRQSGDLTQVRQVARRFGWGTLVAITVLAAMGSAMASHHHPWADGKLHLKLALVGVVCACGLASEAPENARAGGGDLPRVAGHRLAGP